MKQTIYFILIALFLSECTSSDIIIDDFESDNFNNWKITGSAFGDKPASELVANQQNVEGIFGKYFVYSKHGGDNSEGTLTSKEFVIKRDYINFLLGGGKHKKTCIELIVDGKSVYSTSPPVESDELQQMVWDVKAYKDKSATIKIIDNQQGHWGHVMVDEIVMSNTKRSEIMLNHIVSFEGSHKYILMPIEDKAHETSVQLIVDGKKVRMPMNIRIAKTKIDHWVPIDVEQYKGKSVELQFNTDKKDIGYSQIKFSDTFEFDYNEKYRPSYHFSPQYGWMNDPNGMVYKDGVYHLFFQHNPYGSRWGNMHWGHATSRNLIKWEYKGDALAPDSIGTIFSGSAVVDKDNTAGFGKDAIVAIYTSAGKEQIQSIAYSTDNGETFTAYADNPVVTNPGIVDFRDPKVFWHEESNQWVMTLATWQTITFYGSANLKEWHKLSVFGGENGRLGRLWWECPDLIPMEYKGKTKWVLLVSTNPGGPNGGSSTRYFIGNFNGKEFTPDENIPNPLWLDWGRDNYAGVTWSNIPDEDGRKIFIGWMVNLDYSYKVPTLNFRSTMTLPRELKLANNGKHLMLTSSPVEELKELRKYTKKIDNFSVDKEYTIDRLLKDNSGAYEIEMTIETGKSNKFSFALANKHGESVDFIFDISNKQLLVDRSNCDLKNFSKKFAKQANKSPLMKLSTYKIRLFIDKSSSEIFINDGELVQTNIILPNEPFNILKLNSDSKLNIKDMKVHTL